MSKWYFDKGPESDVVLSCRVRIARNFQEYPFPHRATSETRKKILERSVNAVLSSSDAAAEQFRYVDYSALPDVEKQLMIEKHLVSKELLERPKETGVIIDRSFI